MGEGLCCEAAAFYAAETLHGVVPVTHQIFQILADVAVAGLVFLIADGSDVHPVRGVEHLGLCAAHNLEVV